MLTVKCECCSGTGQRPLTELEQETLAAVGNELSTTSAILRRIPKATRPAPTALCNRLTRMEAIGLVKRTRQGSAPGRGHGQALLWSLVDRGSP